MEIIEEISSSRISPTPCVTSPSTIINVITTDLNEISTEAEIYKQYFFSHSESVADSSVSNENSIDTTGNITLNSELFNFSKSRSESSPLLLKSNYMTQNTSRSSHFRIVSDKLFRYSKKFESSKKLPECQNPQLKKTLIKFIETTTAHGIPM
ncbi:hypothetical protein DICVIV_13313, partial [Dictyocaulus viviparus]